MRGPLVLVAAILLVREITVFATIENDVVIQLQKELLARQRFLATGCDKKKGSKSTIAQHAAFTGSKTHSLLLAKTFRKKLLIFKAYLKKFNNVDFALSQVKNSCPNNIICDITAKYRTADGSCNNLANPTFGQSFIAMRRFLKPQYGDGISSPRTIGASGKPLPSARLVSTTVHTRDPNFCTFSQTLSHMTMQWAQFLDHDITLTPFGRGEEESAISCCEEDFTQQAFADGLGQVERPECFKIPVPPNDRRFNRAFLNFVRSLQVDNADCKPFPAEQLNDLTAYIDGSGVYGSTREEQEDLRLGRGGQQTWRHRGSIRLYSPRGLLRTSQQHPELLPRNEVLDCVTFEPPNFCFRAGDERVDEQMALASMHTIWLREHNRIARILSKINPQSNDEQLFQEARRIVGAMIQQITFVEFLPLVLPFNIRRRFGLLPSNGNDPYNPLVDASINNAFATASYRFGHSLIRSTFNERNETFRRIRSNQLRNLFGNTAVIIGSNGEAINTLARGLTRDPAYIVDRHITPEVTDQLFLDPETGDALDLMALNIQRGRDHGLPSYSDFREFCGLSKVTNFGSGSGGLTDHAKDAREALRAVYTSAEDIDLWTGGVSELPVHSGLLGPTFTCLVARQFRLLKTGDRFFYERQGVHTAFTAPQLREIRKTSLARVLCDNTSINRIQPLAMKRPRFRNSVVGCSTIPGINFDVFKL